MIFIPSLVPIILATGRRRYGVAPPPEDPEEKKRRERQENREFWMLIGFGAGLPLLAAGSMMLFMWLSNFR